MNKGLLHVIQITVYKSIQVTFRWHKMYHGMVHKYLLNIYTSAVFLVIVFFFRMPYLTQQRIMSGESSREEMERMKERN